MKYEKLIFVDAEKNSNKEYEMREKGDGTFDITFTRVGKTPQHDNQPMKRWDSKLNEKLKKGYKKITHLVTVVETQDAALSGDASIDAFLTRLLESSKNAFKQTYRVSAAAITQLQVDAVQEVINKINDLLKVNDDVTATHSLFIELWHILPREMSDVRWYLPKSIDGAKITLAQEQDNIDNANVQKFFVSTGENLGLLDNLGIEISPKLVAPPQDLLDFMGSKWVNVKGVYRVSKPSLETRFKAFVDTASDKTTSLRYHGTKWQNGMAILQTGLRILGSKSATYSGSMLGDAIYTSRDFDKSRNYSDGLMFVLNVHTGKPLMVTEERHVRNYTWDDLQKLGYHSVNADPGVYTGWVRLQRHEQTIYREDQQTFMYILDVK